MATKLTKVQKEALTEKVTGLIRNGPALRMTTDSSVNEMNINQISGELNWIHYRAIGKDLPAVFSFEPKQLGSGDPSPDNIRPIVGYEIDGIGTVYGGKLNIETGELQILWSVSEISDRSAPVTAWNKSINALNGFFVAQPIYSVGTAMLCNMFIPTSDVQQYYNNYGVCYHDRSFCFNCDPALCGITQQTWYDYIRQLRINGTPLIAASTLATPITYTLTQQQMLQLLYQL